MILKNYLKENNITQKRFGELIGKDKVYVHRLVKRGAVPSKEDMPIVCAATNGDVQPNDFYDLPNL